jgi:[NiFe] hydrogenase diaphorase moiety large subunit
MGSLPQRPDEPRYVVCNADEGEPGTFKDRVLLTTQADLVFEGMTVCAYAIKAPGMVSSTCAANTAICWNRSTPCWRRRAANLLGDGILGQAEFDFDIESISVPAPMSAAKNRR